MTKEHYDNLLDNKEYARDYPKLVTFLKLLVAAHIPLCCIDTNDWGCNLRPSVYVHNRKYNRFETRRYSRCAVTDAEKAIRFCGRC